MRFVQPSRLVVADKVRGVVAYALGRPLAGGDLQPAAGAHGALQRVEHEEVLRPHEGPPRRFGDADAQVYDFAVAYAVFPLMVPFPI